MRKGRERKSEEEEKGNSKNYIIVFRLMGLYIVAWWDCMMVGEDSLYIQQEQHIAHIPLFSVFNFVVCIGLYASSAAAHRYTPRGNVLH
jgi:hypothetical protein